MFSLQSVVRSKSGSPNAQKATAYKIMFCLVKLIRNVFPICFYRNDIYERKTIMFIFLIFSEFLPTPFDLIYENA